MGENNVASILWVTASGILVIHMECKHCSTHLIRRLVSFPERVKHAIIYNINSNIWSLSIIVELQLKQQTIELPSIEITTDNGSIILWAYLT